MKRSEKDRLTEEWNRGVNFNNFEDISNECLGYIVDEINNKEIDEKTKTNKRDRSNDYLITRFFYRENENKSTGIRNEEYGYDLSEEFIKKVEQAIKEAEEKGDNARTEKLRTILNIANETKTGIEREETSEVIHNFRYMELNGEKIKVTDESLMSQIEHFFEELGQQASAGYALSNSIYVYLTNAKNATDLLDRLKVVDEKIDKYKEKLEEYGEFIQGGMDQAKKDLHYNGKENTIDETKKDVMGLDLELE